MFSQKVINHDTQKGGNINYRTEYNRKCVSAALGAKAMIRGTAILNNNISIYKDA